MTRPLRADARRNRAKVLTAAEDVFATHGTGASTEEIAQAAGVGIGTVFRHFPTKEALLEAVFVARLDRLAEQVRAAAESPDPGAAFREQITLVVDSSPSKNALADALAAAGVEVNVGKTGVREALDLLLRRAQEAGVVRAELDVPTVMALLIGASHGVEAAGDDPERRALIIRVLLDGMSAG
ncbi:TetR/AcrR family transcriptional regulator [Cryptosporangium sp. NPDC048952]|uniref:TetR/AcrR family transcriptional regulator n=1 Tax=Cryptosporangium sp. NPDC048952 TaxID=3363961 RepID=UPI00371F698D